MAATVLVLQVTAGSDRRVLDGDRTRGMQNIVRWLRRFIAKGQLHGDTLLCKASAVRASATVTQASSSGTITATINGVAVAITWATDDTTSAALLAAAINKSENPLVRDHVTATSALGVTTITARYPGHAGNAISLGASGTNVTKSGVLLTGGTSTDTQFTQ